MLFKSWLQKIVWEDAKKAFGCMGLWPLRFGALARIATTHLNRPKFAFTMIAFSALIGPGTNDSTAPRLRHPPRSRAIHEK